MMSKSRITFCTLLIILLVYIGLLSLPLTESQGENRSIRNIDWNSETSRIAVLSSITTVEIYDIDRHTIIFTYEPDEGVVLTDIEWSPDGTKLAIAESVLYDQVATVKIFDTETGDLVIDLIADVTPSGFMIPDGGDTVRAISWHPDGVLLVGAVSKYTGSVQERWGIVWDTETGEIESVVYFSGDNIAWSSDGHRILRSSVGGRASITTLEADDYIVMDTLAVSAVAWSPQDDFVATGNVDGEVQIWDSESGELIQTFVPDRLVDRVAWHPDGERIASASGSLLHVWDIESGESVFSLQSESVITAFDWSPDGSEIVYGLDDDGVLQFVEIEP